MTERFVVIPVGQGDNENREEVPEDGGRGAGGDVIDHQGVIPILEYSREPNKYGKTNYFRQKFESRCSQTCLLPSFALTAVVM